MPAWTPGAANVLTAAPAFQVTSVQLGNGTVTLTWEAVAGRTYRVEHKATLADPQWTPLVPDVTATGPAATATDPVASPAQRFYRVRQLD
jgi:hypothetical protein